MLTNYLPTYLPTCLSFTIQRKQTRLRLDTQACSFKILYPPKKRYFTPTGLIIRDIRHLLPLTLSQCVVVDALYDCINQVKKKIFYRVKAKLESSATEGRSRPVFTTTPHKHARLTGCGFFLCSFQTLQRVLCVARRWYPTRPPGQELSSNISGAVKIRHHLREVHFRYTISLYFQKSMFRWSMFEPGSVRKSDGWRSRAPRSQGVWSNKAVSDIVRTACFWLRGGMQRTRPRAAMARGVVVAGQLCGHRRTV